MFSLNRTSRRALIGSAVSAFIAAFALVPSEVASRLGPGPPVSLPPAEQIATIPLPIVPDRDPFDAPVADDPDVPHAPFTPGVPELFRIRPLPPSAGAGAAPFAARSTAPRVLAVVTGPRPSALIEEHGQTRLVAAGDPVDGSRIASIDGTGVGLEDGRRLNFTVSAEVPRL